MTTDEPPVVIPNYSGWLTLEQVAAKAGVGYYTALRWVKVGLRIGRERVRLKAVKLAWAWKIDPAAVGPFVELARANPPKPFPGRFTSRKGVRT